MTDDLRAMGVVLKSRGVTAVATEFTGVYWANLHLRKPLIQAAHGAK